MIKRIFAILSLVFLLAWFAIPTYAVLPNIFATQPAGNVAASLLDTNFTFLESQGVQGLTTTGTTNAYIATPADAWVTGYSSYVGRALTVIPNFTNTGAATVNVSGLGNASLYKNVGGTATALASGDIKANIPAILICDGTGFLLANPTPASTATTVTSATVSSSYNLTTASGTQTVSGFGFTPSACDGFGAVGGSSSVQYITFSAHSDSALNQESLVASGGDFVYNGGLFFLAQDTGGSNAQQATITSYNSGSVTLTWTKTGTPSGTFSFSIRCFK